VLELKIACAVVNWNPTMPRLLSTSAGVAGVLCSPYSKFPTVDFLPLLASWNGKAIRSVSFGRPAKLYRPQTN